MRRWPWAVGGVIAIIGCSFSSLDDLSATAPPDAGGGDASDDAATPSDAGAGDAAAAIDAFVAPGCDGHRDASFCDDFDEGGAIGLTWSTFLVTGNGAVTFTSSDSVSAPRSMHASIQGIDASVADMSAALRRSFVASATHAHLALDIRVASAGDPYAVGPAIRFVSTDGVTVTFRTFLQGRVWAAGHQALLPDGGGPPNVGYDLTQSPPPGAWSHVEIDFRIAPPHGRITIDKQIAFDGDLPNIIAIGAPAATVGLTQVHFPTSSWNVFIDNVVFDFD